MSKKDYTKFSKNHNDNRNKSEQQIVPEVIPEVIPEVAYPLPEDDLPTIVVDGVEQKPVIYGKVTGCSKLNVRQDPNLQADILCCLEVNTEVEIDEGKSTNEFYAICTPSGREGFCMKKFIEVRK